MKYRDISCKMIREKIIDQVPKMMRLHLWKNLNARVVQFQ
jgi:hypothetical protein